MPDRGNVDLVGDDHLAVDGHLVWLSVVSWISSRVGLGTVNWGAEKQFRKKKRGVIPLSSRSTPRTD